MSLASSSIRMPELRHKDAFGRVTIPAPHVDQEYFLQPKDGRLEVLITQYLQQADADKNRSNWNGIVPQNQTPALIRVLHWVYPGHYDSHDNAIHDTFILLCARYVTACFLIPFFLIFPTTIDNETKNGGNYDPVLYKDWKFPKVSRNSLESPKRSHGFVQDTSTSHQIQSPARKPIIYTDDEDIVGGIKISVEDDECDLIERGTHDETEECNPYLKKSSRPTHLCKWQKDTSGTGQTIFRYKVQKISESDPSPEYIFVSYTRDQFVTDNAARIRGSEKDSAHKNAFLNRYQRDRATLLKYGIRAAYEANVPAFWVDFKCIPRKEGDQSSFTNEIYNISEVVRAAHSMVIVTGWPNDEQKPQDIANAKSTWLRGSRGWGSRLWTLPEILLCSTEHRVKIYARGEPEDKVHEVAKRNFAFHAWEDAEEVRQLIDHYETLHLSRLELASIALELFLRRKRHFGYQGDPIYSLMGLFRLRPKVNTEDSSFEAFAHLSMENDSDKLLERLICMLPSGESPPWHEIKDHWKSKLWDIEPHCQVAGIVDKQTITLDGAFAAAIQWDSLGPVAFLKRKTNGRTLQKMGLRVSPSLLIIGSFLVTIFALIISRAEKASKASSNSPSENTSLIFLSIVLLIIAATLLLVSLIFVMLSPVILWNLCGGKFWSTQASLYGIEGDVELGAVEEFLFGLNCKRLHWSANGSDISQHVENDDHTRGECRGEKPSRAHLVPGKRLFTIIDTFTMTVFQIHAAKPPTAAIVCGREGGMQRALLCSYDWRTATYCRETVLRMETVVLDKMPRIRRFRFAFSRPTVGVEEKD